MLEQALLALLSSQKVTERMIASSFIYGDIEAANVSRDFWLQRQNLIDRIRKHLNQGENHETDQTGDP